MDPFDNLSHLAQDNGYLEKPALHPGQTTNNVEIHRMKTTFMDKLLIGDDSLLGMHSAKILGAFGGAAFAFYMKKPQVWPYAAIGACMGWIVQLKCCSDPWV
jgi:hypothetical protein